MMLRYLLVCALLCVKAGYAGEVDPVKYIGIEHGLSNNAVTSIYQDHQGFMWFGTYDGLNRYDGYSFKIFRNIIGDRSSLGDNHVISIEGDANHNLWIGCEKGVYIYHPITAQFSRPQYKPWNETTPQPVVEVVPSIRHVQQGNFMLVGTSNKGLLVFKKSSLTGLQIPLEGVKGRGSYSVTSIATDPRNEQAWIMIHNIGLCRYDFRTGRLQITNTSVKESDCLTVDHKGELWMGSENGLFRFDRHTNRFSSNMMPSRYRVIQIFEDRKNTLWIASDGGGVWHMPSSSEEPRPYLSSRGTPMTNSNAVYSIYEDQEGRKWIGTLRGGINLVQPFTSSFKTVTYDPPGQSNMVNNFILSFCEDATTNLWIGTDGAGLRYWDRHKNSFTTYVNDPSNKNSLSSNFVTSILKDAADDLWICTWFGGVNRVKKNSKSFERFTFYNPKTNTPENNAWVIYEDIQKQLWVSTTNTGTLYRLDRSANAFELFDDKIINVQCLTEDKSNNFWAGNYTSLIRIDRKEKKHETYHLGYTVRCLMEDRNRNFWVGTDGGGLLLFNRNNGTFKRFSTADGLPSNTILRILEDRNHYLWISTYNGICKFDPASGTSRNFSQSDGLQSNQFSFNAGLALKSGEFVFGGIKGFTIFHPDSVYDKKEIPRIFLTGLKINNTPVEQNGSYVTDRALETIQQVTVPYAEAIFSLDFIALEYTGADKIKYAYQLEGWDKDWIYANNIRTANYTRLREGDYTFKIRVTSSDGVWSGETRLLKILVLPPWYRTWWAYLAYGLILFGMIYFYIVYSKRQERLKYEVKLAHLENEKEKELTEKKISFFTHISHEFRTPLTLIINPLKELVSRHNDSAEKRDIFMVYRNARRLLSLVDQLLLFRKVESIDQQLRIEKFDIVEACTEVYLSFGHHAQSKNIRFTLDKSGDQVFIYGDKEKIEIILFNLVSNAFKYTHPGGQVGIVINELSNEVLIQVRDTGTGIPEEVGNKLFESFYQAGNTDKASQTGFGIGLYVSQKLAAAHNGMISYRNHAGQGTEFELRLLKGKEHLGSMFISEDYHPEKTPTILHELVDEPSEDEVLVNEAAAKKGKALVIDQLTSDLPAMLVVDDNADIRSYVKGIFRESFNVFLAEDGTEAYDMIINEPPDIVISDVRMKKMGGIELCQKIKNNLSIAHIPVILLTASSSDEIKLKGIEGGAEDYITKPFDKNLIIARVQNILKGRNRLQQYFFNAVTLKPTANIPGEHKEFIERCITIVETHLDNPDFTIQTFCKAIGMSHPSLYKKVKAVSGLTVNVFIRYIRLRKAAELLITTDKTITEITYITGFNDIRYFREQFFELFQMKPSDYIKRYRKVLGNKVVKS